MIWFGSSCRPIFSSASTSEGTNAMVASLLALAIIVIKFWPETELARRLRAILVDAPIRLGSRIQRRHLLFIALALVIFPIAGELLVMPGAVDVALAGMWNLAVYLDAASAILFVAAASKTRSLIPLARSRFRVFAARARAGRRRVRPAAKSRSDDGEDAGAAWLARAAFA
jgi:hypothetical protein